jgi:hypothetical protein
LSASAAFGEGRVELNLLTEDRVPITSQQEWSRRLGQAGISSLRIRSAGPVDSVRLTVDVQGSEVSPTYVVTGVITADDVLVLPGGKRFRSTQAAQVAQWVDDLARLGPEDRRPAKTAFGLTAAQFQQVHDALAEPLTASTKGSSRAEVVQSIARRLALPVRYGRLSPEAIGSDEVGEELSGLSCGTALAYALRASGLCLVPRPAAAGAELDVVAAEPNLEAWPIGWQSEKPDREVLPGLYEFLNVKLDGVAVTKVLEALGERLKVPVLVDHNAMARHGVDPDTAYVSYPEGRTTYSLLLRKALFQARLKSEVRVDESGKPLLWITTLKPL